MEDVRWGPIAVSILTFVVTYTGVAISKAHRAILSLAGAVLMIVLGSWLTFYTPTEAVRSINFDAIMLLVGMMIVVGLLRQTGSFQYVAIRLAKAARGKPWLLLIYLGAVTTLTSMILDNVTTLLILIPVTISLLDILDLSIAPFLVSEVILANVGGVTTLIGSPPNMLIGSAAGLGFSDLLVRLAPIVVVAWAGAQTLLLLLFRRELSNAPKNMERLMGMNERRAIVDRRAAHQMGVTLGLMLTFFVVHERIGVEPGLVALAGACLSILWLRPDFDQILNDLHWDTLVFVLALFVLAGGLASSGVFTFLGTEISAWSSQGVSILAVLVLWIGALASNVIGSVPVTIAALPLIHHLVGHGPSATPLWIALALGVGFGVGLTPLGIRSNVALADLLRAVDSGETIRQWGRRGTWIALLTCVLGSIGVLVATRAGWFG